MSTDERPRPSADDECAMCEPGHRMCAHPRECQYPHLRREPVPGTDEHPRPARLEPCANGDGQIQVCRCGGSECPGWCHLTGGKGAGHWCWPFDNRTKATPTPATEWCEFLDQHWQGKREHKRGTF